MSRSIPRNSVIDHRVSYATESSVSLSTADSFYSADEHPSDNDDSYSYYPRTTQLRREGTWNSTGASTIRLSGRQQSVISHTSSYYSSSEFNHEPLSTHNNTSQPKSTVLFDNSSTSRNLTKISADSLQSNFTFDSQGPSRISYPSPSSIQSGFTINENQHNIVESPENVTCPSPKTPRSVDDRYPSLQILEHQELEPSVTRHRNSIGHTIPVRDVKALSYHSSPDEESIFAVDSSLDKTAAAIIPRTNNSTPTFSLKASKVAYGSEAFDISYESSTKSKNISHQPSPLLPPNIKHSRSPFLTPGEPYPHIFDNTNANIPTGTSGIFRVESGQNSEEFDLNKFDVSNPKNPVKQQNPRNDDLPYIVHPARPFMPHIYRMRNMEEDALDKHLSDQNPIAVSSSQLSLESPSENLDDNSNTNKNLNLDRKRVSKLALIPVYDSPNIDSVSKFPFKNSQIHDRVVETPLYSPTHIGASANTTEKLDRTYSETNRSAPVQGFKHDPSKVVRFETNQTPLRNNRTISQLPKPTHQSSLALLGAQSNYYSRPSNPGGSDEGMRPPLVPNLFSTRSSIRHSRVSSGMLPPVATRNPRRSKSARKNSSISSISSLLHNTTSIQQNMPVTHMPHLSPAVSLHENESDSEALSMYADAITGSTKDLSIISSTPENTSAVIPSLPISLPRTAPNPPEITEVSNPLDTPAQSKKYRGQDSDFIARVKRSRQGPHQSIADDDAEFTATAAAAQAIIDDEWPIKINSHRLINEKIRSYDDHGNPVCNPSVEPFLLCVFLLFPPLWLLLAAGFFDNLLGEVSTRTKFIAYIFSAVFFVLAIAGLIVGLVVGMA